MLYRPWRRTMTRHQIRTRARQPADLGLVRGKESPDLLVWGQWADDIPARSSS